MLAFLTFAFLGIVTGCNFSIGSFGPGGDFIYNYALAQGYFPSNFHVCFVPIASSNDQYQGLVNGTFEVITGFADNVIAKAMAAEDIRNADLCLISGGDLGPHQSLSGNIANGITSVQNLTNKDILVDSPDTGAVVILYKLLHDANITNNTFTQGGGASRLGKLIAGTFNGHPTYATMNFYPTSAPQLLNHKLDNIAFAKNHYWPYQSMGAGAKCSWAAANKDVLVTYFEAIAKSYYWFATNPDAAISLLNSSNPTWPAGFAATYYASYFGNDDGPVTNYSFIPHRAAMCKNVVTRQAIQNYGENYFSTWIPMNTSLIPNAWTYVLPNTKPNESIGNGNGNGNNKYRGPVYIDALLAAIENVVQELNIPDSFPWEHPTSQCKNLCDISTVYPGDNGVVPCTSG